MNDTKIHRIALFDPRNDERIGTLEYSEFGNVVFSNGIAKDLFKIGSNVFTDPLKRIYRINTLTMEAKVEYSSKSFLIHYSETSDIKSLDPDFMGTGKTPSTEMKEKIPQPHRVYTYDNDAIPEDVVYRHAKFRYRVYVDPEMIYDIGDDELGLKTGEPDHLHEKLLTEVKKRGYLGFTNSRGPLPGVVALFRKTPVYDVEPLY
jgi:hypothetical protein